MQLPRTQVRERIGRAEDPSAIFVAIAIPLTGKTSLFG